MPGYGFGHRFSRRRSFQSDDTSNSVEVLYGPKIGPKGPKQILFGVWNQAPTGYCYETNNPSENLYAKWAARGINTIKASHPDVVVGNQAALLAAVEANNLMLIASPVWDNTLIGNRPDPAAHDLRDLALNNPYLRVNWISYAAQDEMDLFTVPLSTQIAFLEAQALDGVSKPIAANFTRRAAIPATSEQSGTINWHNAFNHPLIRGLSIDSYEWHLDNTDLNSATLTASSPQIFTSTWHGGGPYNSTPGQEFTRTMFGRRFTSSITGMAVHLMRTGPLSPGRSDDGLLPVDYPPIAFNAPPYTAYGTIVLPVPNTYAPEDKWTGHFVCTSRGEIAPGAYGRAGQWQPGRFLRNESWSGFTHGSSALYLFPQTVSTKVATGYIDTVNNTVVITTEPSQPFLFGGAVRLTTEGNFTLKGWVRRDNPQLSGTPGGAGVYALDVTKAAPVATGTAATPVPIQFASEARPWGDDSNPENLAELAAIIANMNRLQAHPTGGNLMIDTMNGGRRPFVVMRCPDINGDASLYREDMTLAPVQPGYTSEGVPIPDSGGGLPLWDFGWPMGFEGFRVTGDDGATYLYVRSLSNSNRPTWFPGYAPLGLPARVFRAFETVEYRRAGADTAVETGGIIKANVDDGPATWFWIDTTAITQAEGNSGSTAYAVTVRRGGVTSGTDSVTASASGTGLNPATAADFGGTFPSQVLTFAPGETSKVFTVNVSGDTSAEADETFKVALSAPSTGTALVGSNRSEITCTITNDDAQVAASFVWLVKDLNATPALPGSPIGATHLKVTETTNVTRGGVTMRSVNSFPPVSDNGGFANTPYWQIGNSFAGVRFEIPAGSWEFAVIATAPFGGINGTVTIVDNPSGDAIVRQSLVLNSAPSGASSLLLDSNNAAYTNASTAVAGAVNNLNSAFKPVQVTDLGGGSGVVQVYANGVNVTAVALRQV
jgi:hypothetical protein